METPAGRINSTLYPALLIFLLQILAGRSEKRQLGSRKGNTFSIATFAAAGAPEAEADEDAVDAKTFWAEMLPEAAAAHAAALQAAKQPEVGHRMD